MLYLKRNIDSLTLCVKPWSDKVFGWSAPSMQLSGPAGVAALRHPALLIQQVQNSEPRLNKLYARLVVVEVDHGPGYVFLQTIPNVKNIKNSIENSQMRWRACINDWMLEDWIMLKILSVIPEGRHPVGGPRQSWEKQL